MNGTIRSPSSSEASAAPGCSSFFTGPVCLYGPADLERDFSISKRAAEARAGQGRARDGEEDNEMERLMTQTTISSAYSADAPPSPVSASGYDDRLPPSFEIPMYSHPVVSACTVSRDGAFVAAVAGHSLIVWKWTGRGWALDARAKLPEKVKYMSVAFLRAQLEVAAAGSDGTTYVVQRSSGNPVTSMRHVLEEPAGQQQQRHASFYTINSMVVSSREHYLATCGGDGRAVVWDVATKFPLLVVKYDPEGQRGLSTDRWRPSGPFASLVRTETLSLLREEVHGVDALYACDVSADELWLVTGGESQDIDVWSLSTIQPVGDSAPAVDSQDMPARQLKGHDSRISALCFSPSGSTLASADVTGVLRVWSMDTGVALLQTRAHSLMVSSLAFVPQDDNMLISGGLDAFICVWRLPDDAQAGSAPLVPVLCLRGHASGVTHLCCFRRGGVKKRGAAAGSSNNSKQPSSASSLESASSPSSHGGHGSETTDSLCLLSSGVDQRLWVWGLGADTLQYQRALSLPLHVLYRGKQLSETTISHASLSCVSSLLATTRYQDIRAFVWHVQGDKAGQLGMMLNGHQRAITCLAFARRDEALIAAGDESGRVCVWRLQPQGGALGSWSAPPAVYTQANLPWLKGGQQVGGGGLGRHAGLLEPEYVWNDHAAGVRSLCFGGGQDSQLVSCDVVSQIRVMDLESRQLLHTIRGGEAVVGPVHLLHALEDDDGMARPRSSSYPAAMAVRPWSTGEPFVVSSSEAEVLVWRARTGDVHARLSLADDQLDSVTDMDCYWAPPGRIHVCALTLAGNVAVWSVSTTSEPRTAMCWLDLPRGSAPPPEPSSHKALLSGLRCIAFQQGGRRVLAWGPSRVAIWERQQDGPAAPAAAASTAEESGTSEEPPPWEAPGEHGEVVGTGRYILVSSRQTGEAGFMKGCCLARLLEGKEEDEEDVLRLVLKEGWVIDRAVLPKRRPSVR